MHQMRISTTQVSFVMLSSKTLEIREKVRKLKEPSDENQTECHEIEQNPSKNKDIPEKIILRFKMNLHNFFFDSSIHICILKQVPKY
jgi:hypothetical protein